MPKQTKPIIKKEKPTADSTNFFQGKVKLANENVRKAISTKMDKIAGAKSQEVKSAYSQRNKAVSDVVRQSNKGKVGYDKNGYPKK